MHPAALPPDTLLSECRMTRTRRSGPGGQHRNKVETAIVIEHLPTGVIAEAAEARQQARNRAVAIDRLRMALAIQVRSERQSEPSPLWSARCRGGRLSISARHEDFPALVAEALDVLVREGFDQRRAAEGLRISPTQLIRLLRRVPAAFQWVNSQRQAAGLHRLR